MTIVTPLFSRADYAGALELAPGDRAVVPDAAAHQLRDRLGEDGVRLSSVANYARRYGGHRDCTVLARRGCGLGDQMVWAGLCRILRDLFACRVTLALHPSLWHVLAIREPDAPARLYCDKVIADAIPWATWTAHDRHLMGEGLVEADREPDQPNIYDSHLTFAGIDPATVPAELKRPPCMVAACHLQAACTELAEALPLRGLRKLARRARWSAKALPEHRAELRRALGGRPLLAWQIGATSQVRSVSPKRTAEQMADVLADWPGALIVALGDSRQRDALRPLAPAGVLLPDTSGRGMFGLVALATALVAPDSCGPHLAAGLPEPTPVVGLWGSFAPSDRARYYPRHSPLFNELPCGPCRRHDGDGRGFLGCPTRRGGHCQALDDISGLSIATALSRAIDNKHGEQQ
jgi:hypothetical protein